MNLYTTYLHPEAKLETKDGIHVQEGDEKTLPHFELGMPDGIGPYSRVAVDPDLFALVPRRYEECPLNGQLPEHMVDGKLVCPACGVTADELRIRRQKSGEMRGDIEISNISVTHDTIDVPNRLMEGHPVMVDRNPRIVEDVKGDDARIGVLFVAEADTAMLCWIELDRLDRRRPGPLHILHSRMLGTRTDSEEGVKRHSQERFVVMAPGDAIRICRKQYDEQHDEVLKTESFVIRRERNGLRIASHLVQEPRKESHVSGAQTQ